MYRMDGEVLGEEDLQLLGDLICELLPADSPVSADLLWRLRDAFEIVRDATMKSDKQTRVVILKSASLNVPARPDGG